MENPIKAALSYAKYTLERDIYETETELNDLLNSSDDEMWYVGHNYNHYGFDTAVNELKSELDELNEMLDAVKELLQQYRQWCIYNTRGEV